MEKSLRQRLETRLEGQLLHIRLSELLELSERDYRRWVALLEKDPLYGLLSRPSSDAPRVIRRERWAQTRYKALESAPEPAAPADLTPDSATVALIQSIGQQAFERYFLYNEETPLPEAAGACGLKESDARLIQDFVDGTLSLAGTALPAAPASAPGPELVAAFEKGPGGLEIVFGSAHYARGRYRIDYDGLETLKRSGALPKSELGHLRQLLAQLESANAKQTVLAGLLSLALTHQAKFLETGEEAALEAMPQKDAAERLAVSASAVSRALAGRLVRAAGRLLPAAALFPSRRTVAVAMARELLAREPRLRDRELGERLRERLGRPVSVRNANHYRKQARGG